MPDTAHNDWPRARVHQSSTCLDHGSGHGCMKMSLTMWRSLNLFWCQYSESYKYTDGIYSCEHLTLLYWQLLLNTLHLYMWLPNIQLYVDYRHTDSMERVCAMMWIARNYKYFVVDHVPFSSSLFDQSLHHCYFVVPSLNCNLPCNSKVHTH